MARKRGQIYSPGGYLLDCSDCDAQFSFTEEEVKATSLILWHAGWTYFRGWYCPACAAVHEIPDAPRSLPAPFLKVAEAAVKRHVQRMLDNDGNE